MIYTTYFAKLKSFPDDITPVSICRKSPAWYRGLEYKKLAPTYEILTEYKRNPNEARYISRYNREILAALNADKIYKELTELTGNHSFALVCYEKPSDFCHRHLAAEWLKRHGYECAEFSGGVIFGCFETA